RAGVRAARRSADARGRHGDRGAAQEARARPGAADGDRVGQGRRVRLEAGAVTSSRRVLAAAALLAVLLAGLLGAWFVAGWSGVRDRQRAVRDAPRLAAEQRAGELAHQLRAELAQLLAREVERPY